MIGGRCACLVAYCRFVKAVQTFRYSAGAIYVQIDYGRWIYAYFFYRIWSGFRDYGSFQIQVTTNYRMSIQVFLFQGSYSVYSSSVFWCLDCECGS